MKIILFLLGGLAFSNFSIMAQNVDNGNLKEVDMTPIGQVQKETGVTPFEVLDVRAEAGFDIRKFLFGRFNYPDEVWGDTNFVAVRIQVEFIVEKDATISNIRIKHFENLGAKNIQQSTQTVLSREVIRVMRKMPQWKSPGYKDGEAKRSYYMVPFHINAQ